MLSSLLLQRGQSILSMSASREPFLTVFLLLMIADRTSLVVRKSVSRTPILFSAALCILSNVGRSAFLMAFSVRSGVADSSLLCPSSSSSSSSSLCVSSSFGWSGSSSSWGASGASELDELDDELSDDSTC